MTADQFAMQRLTTEDVPRRERMAFVHDFVGRHIGGLHFNPFDRDNIRIDLEAMFLPGGLTVGQGRFAPIHGARTRDLLQDGRQHFLMSIHYEDYEISADGKEPIRVPAGDVTLVDEGVCSEFWFAQRMAVDVVALDRRLLAKLAPRVDMEALYILPAAGADMRLLTSYVGIIRANPPGTEKAREIASRHIYDLTALVLSGVVRGGTERNERSIAAARLKMIRKDIVQRLADPELQIDAVARRQGVTPRYVQRLFEAEGVTFSEFVREQRLGLAFKLLQERDPASSTITDIAFEAGFSDISAFNRAFRRRFDATPSDVRAMMLARIRAARS